MRCSLANWILLFFSSAEWIKDFLLLVLSLERSPSDIRSFKLTCHKKITLGDPTTSLIFRREDWPSAGNLAWLGWTPPRQLGYIQQTDKAHHGRFCWNGLLRWFHFMPFAQLLHITTTGKHSSYLDRQAGRSREKLKQWRTHISSCVQLYNNITRRLSYLTN